MVPSAMRKGTFHAVATLYMGPSGLQAARSAGRRAALDTSTDGGTSLVA
jgi:hypothetical protein